MKVQEQSQSPWGAHHQPGGDNEGDTPPPPSHRPHAMWVTEPEPLLQVGELQGGRRS